MAYIVLDTKSAVTTANATVINNAVKALLGICPQESYPNGNNGMSETHIRKYFKNLSDCGAALEVVQRGNPSIMGVYTYTLSNNATDWQARKAYEYALSEIKEYASNVSDNDTWKKWRILHALETLNPDALSIDGCIVSLNGTKFGEYASINKMLPEILAVLEKGL